MARPIEHTPILSGEDAKRFREDVMASFHKSQSPENYQTKIEAIKEMQASYTFFERITNGKFSL